MAHVVATAGATGVESYLLMLLASFERSRVEPVLFVPGPGPLVDRARGRGIPVETEAPAGKLDLAAERRLARRWTGAFDLVHSHGPRATFWARRAARRARLPLVVTVHELRWQTLPPSPRRALWVWLEGRSLADADRLVTVSEATRRDLIARWPGLTARTQVAHASAPMMLDPQRIPAARPWRPGAGPPRLVTIGRFDWQKGYDLLFRALAELAGRGVDFTLDIVGHGSLERPLRGLAERVGIAESLRWLGRDADVAATLAASHVFVTATRAEMFGIAVLEAMAVGLPVLAPAVGSQPELVADGETGRLLAFEPESTLPARFADQLCEWLEDASALERLGTGGARRARMTFMPAHAAERVAAVYADLLRRP